MHVTETQTEHLTAALPGEQHRSTIARSRHVRSAATSASTSSGDSTFGKVRGTRTSATVRDVTDPARRRVANPRGTGPRGIGDERRASGGGTAASGAVGGQWLRAR